MMIGTLLRPGRWPRQRSRTPRARACRTARRRRTPRPPPRAPASCASSLDSALRRRIDVLGADGPGARGIAGGGERDPERERRADALLAPDRDRPTVVARHVLDDGEAQPGAAGAAGPRLVDPVEAL